MIITTKNWHEFQHYKDRSPAWIKLHRRILDDYDFWCLPVASRALAPCLWLLASEYDDGKIDASLDAIAFRLRMTKGELADALSPLIESGFFTASEALAERKQDACPEKRREETEEERETEEEKEERGRASAPPKYVFEGRVIRVNRQNYDQWRKSYGAIEDFDAALQAADDYYATNPPKDGKWFFAASNWLKREHAAAVENHRARKDRSF